MRWNSIHGMKASKLNDPEAQFLTGVALFEGAGTKQNPSKAIELLKKCRK